MGPGQKFMRNLRENPDPTLVDFISQLDPGPHTVSTVWKEFNGRTGFNGQACVFRYALLHAGLVEETPNGKLVKP